MKFICFGCSASGVFEKLGEQEMQSKMDECFTYDDELRRNGHMIGGEALYPPSAARTLRKTGGKVTVIDGPYAETKEQVGGLMFLEARDIDEAVQLISKHPGLQFGPWEIRPIADLGEMVRESERRRGLA